MLSFRVLGVTNLWPCEADPGYGSVVRAWRDSRRPFGDEFHILFINGRESRLNHLRPIGRMRRCLGAKCCELMHADFGLAGWVARFQFRVRIERPKDRPPHPDLLRFYEVKYPIEQKLYVMFLEHGMRSFQGAFHMNPDYQH